MHVNALTVGMTRGVVGMAVLVHVGATTAGVLRTRLTCPFHLHQHHVARHVEDVLVHVGVVAHVLSLRSTRTCMPLWIWGTCPFLMSRKTEETQHPR